MRDPHVIGQANHLLAPEILIYAGGRETARPHRSYRGVRSSDAIAAGEDAGQ